jgi:hypothetical protein
MADSNGDRWGECEYVHWDAFVLLNYLLPHHLSPYFTRQARDNSFDGDQQMAMASVYPGDDCHTLYVVEDGLATVEEYESQNL